MDVPRQPEREDAEFFQMGAGRRADPADTDTEELFVFIYRSGQRFASGKTVWVHHRLACPKFVKQTFHEFADQSIRFSRWARAYYDQQRGRGNTHHAALRALAYKWIRILFRCWKERRPYDEDAYVDALRRQGSLLAKNLA